MKRKPDGSLIPKAHRQLAANRKLNRGAKRVLIEPLVLWSSPRSSQNNNFRITTITTLPTAYNKTRTYCTNGEISVSSHRREPRSDCRRKGTQHTQHLLCCFNGAAKGSSTHLQYYYFHLGPEKNRYTSHLEAWKKKNSSPASKATPSSSSSLSSSPSLTFPALQRVGEREKWCHKETLYVPPPTSPLSTPSSWWLEFLVCSPSPPPSVIVFVISSPPPPLYHSCTFLFSPFFFYLHILVHSPSAHATIVVTGVGVSNPTLWNAWATSYLYKVSNVQINYIQTDSSDSALAQISDGRASFVVSDGALPAAILPDQIQAADIVQLPVVGSALVAAYNLPGLSAQLVCFFWHNTHPTPHLFPSFLSSYTHTHPNTPSCS